MPAEPIWSAVHQHTRRISTPPQPDVFASSGSRIRAPPAVGSTAIPPAIRQTSTPPSYDYFTPIESPIRSSPPLNPWNPYLRSYGRVYPYSLGVNQYENAPRNYVVAMRENSPQPRFLPTYQPRLHIVPSYRDYNSSLSSLPPGESMRRLLERPRSNRSFHHYRHSTRETDAENLTRYSSNAVIEISSDDEDARSTPTRPAHHRESPRSLPNSVKMLLCQQIDILSQPQITTAEVKPNIHAHMRTTSSENNISSTANHHHGNDNNTSALNLSNRIKRPHRFSPHSSSKYCRISNEFRQTRSHSQDTTSSLSGDEFEQVRKKPNIRALDENINSTSASQSIENNENGNGNSNNSDNNIEQKFKIRIKREFKTESNPTTNTESNETNQENQTSEANVDTKEHLRPLIADIKQE